MPFLSVHVNYANECMNNYYNYINGTFLLPFFQGNENGSTQKRRKQNAPAKFLRYVLHFVMNSIYLYMYISTYTTYIYIFAYLCISVQGRMNRELL